MVLVTPGLVTILLHPSVHQRMNRMAIKMVFRFILKKSFNRLSVVTIIGYICDESLQLRMEARRWYFDKGETRLRTTYADTDTVELTTAA